MRTVYVYLPGFGDKLNFLRRLALFIWTLRGRRAKLVELRWSNRTETYEDKLERIESVIKSLGKKRIVLIGESASGSVAIALLARDPEAYERVVTLCGYNHGASAVKPHYKKQHPAFDATTRKADQVEETLPAELAAKIVTIYSPTDKVLEPKHTLMPGASVKVLPPFTHGRAIWYGLLRPKSAGLWV